MGTEGWASRKARPGQRAVRSVSEVRPGKKGAAVPCRPVTWACAPLPSSVEASLLGRREYNKKSICRQAAVHWTSTVPFVIRRTLCYMYSLRSCTSKGIGRQGVGSSRRKLLRFNTVPCRPMPLLGHFQTLLYSGTAFTIISTTYVSEMHKTYILFSYLLCISLEACSYFFRFK